MSRFDIRRASPDDAAAICAIHAAAVRTLCAGVYGAAEMDAWIGGRTPGDFRAAMLDGGEVMFVAGRAGRIVGFSSLCGDEIRAVYVDPVRGRGAGAPLLRAVEAEAARQGAGALRLESSLNAEGFYRAMGYGRIEAASVARPNGVELAVVRMAKEL